MLQTLLYALETGDALLYTDLGALETFLRARQTLAHTPFAFLQFLLVPVSFLRCCFLGLRRGILIGHSFFCPTFPGKAGSPFHALPVFLEDTVSAQRLQPFVISTFADRYRRNYIARVYRMIERSNL
jgi:hypothetical protein